MEQVTHVKGWECIEAEAVEPCGWPGVVRLEAMVAMLRDVVMLVLLADGFLEKFYSMSMVG
jgi:hypothetical protein